MGYMLPLTFINVSRDPVVSICATRIVSMMSTKIYQARRSIHEEKKAGTLINACGTSAAKTAIILDNGVIVSSPLSITILMNAIDKANEKISPRNTSKLKVYDVYDDDTEYVEPEEELDDATIAEMVDLEKESEVQDFDEDEEDDDY